MKSLNLAARFLLELASLAALAWCGWQASASMAVSLALAILAPVAFATIWGLLVAPKATHRLDDPGRFALEIVLFAGVTLALAAAGNGVLTLAFALAITANLSLMAAWNQRGL